MRHFVLVTLMEVKEASNAFYAYIFKLYSIPETFVSDRGT